MNNYGKRITLFHWLHEKKIDVACLQETFCTKTFNVNNYYDFDIFHALTDSTHSRGVCIVIRKGLNYKLVNKYASNDGRRLLINIEIGDEVLTIVNLYVPTTVKDRIQFMKRSCAWIKQHIIDNDRLIVSGDMNCCMSAIDRVKDNGDKSGYHLKKLNKDLKLNDVWRDQNPADIKYTYRDISRIDYIFVSHLLSNIVTSAEIINVPKIPDHKAVVAVVGGLEDKGPGYWKLNTSVLCDIKYQEMVKQVVQETTEELHDLNNPCMLWDIIKIRVKEASIKYCTMIRKEAKNELKELEQKLIDYDSMIDKQSDIHKQSEIKEIKIRLKQAYDKEYYMQAKAAQVRSRARYVEEGERSTKYFLSLEKRNQTNNTISALEMENGNTVTDNDGIIAEATNFYRDLYTSKDIKQDRIYEYLKGVNVTHGLTEEEALKCDGDISEGECFKAMSRMKLGKTPGDDGLPVEFYRTLWEIIKDPLIKSYRHSYSTGHLSTSQSRAIITLIHKKGSKKKLKNYRPISLTNVDYKIIAFVLSGRLQSVIAKLIGSQQTAYIKGRFIGQNIRSVLDIMDYTKTFKVPGLLLCLDFRKAFDSLEWNFMHSTIEKFKFGQSFSKWVRILYNEPIAMVKVNGFISEPIKQSRGIRQGCPISALLFILSTEILAISILDNDKIVGIDIPIANNSDMNHSKLSQYADDTTIVLKDENQVLETIATIDAFSEVSGLTLNVEKTEAMWLGSYRNRGEKLFGFQWPTTIRYLGIYIGYDDTETHKLNWINKLELFQKTLDCWRTREITYFGRMVVVKTLGLSKLIYSATMLPLPPNICDNIEKEIDRFVWKGRKRRIKKAVLCRAIDNGGIGQLSIKEHFYAIKASWIPRILRQKNESWNVIARFHLNKFGKDLAILNFTFYDPSQFPGINRIPQFYQEMVVAFNKAKWSKKPSTEEELLGSVIWGNRHFTIGEKCKQETIHNKHWIDQGIMTFGQILLPNGNLDIHVLNTNVCKKHDYLSTQSKIIAVIKSYKYLLKGLERGRGDIATAHTKLDPCKIRTGESEYSDIKNARARFFYENIHKQCNSPIRAIEKWKDELHVQFQVDEAFKCKVKYMTNKKLAAFNFKLLHKVLICGKELYEWKKIPNQSCPFCNDIHSVKHMLFECQNAVFTWLVAMEACQISIQWSDIIIGTGVKHYDYIISLLSFTLYKYWIQALNNKSGGKFHIYLKYELNEIAVVNSLLGNVLIAGILEKIVSHLLNE